jgi:polar amino acid transport system permease protein
MNLFKTGDAPQSQAELLYAARLRKEMQFKVNVALSWIVLLFIMVFLFSGQSLVIPLQNLFSVDARYAASLDTEKMDKALRAEFQERKIPLSTKVKIKTQKPGQKWLLDSSAGQYVALIENGALNIYSAKIFSAIELDTNFIINEIDFIALGLGETLRISVLSIMLAMALALLAALGRLSTFPPIYALSTFYVSLIRGTPLYLQIFFFFLALPQLGIILTGTVAGVLALGLNYGAYMSEVFRAGLSSVGRGQREAAMSLGMTPAQTMRRIVLPQALRFAIPPMGNDFISMTKDSALVSATGFVHELMWRSVKVGRAQFHNLEALIMAALFYWGLTIILSYAQSRLETYLAKGDR